MVMSVQIDLGVYLIGDEVEGGWIMIIIMLMVILLLVLLLLFLETGK